MIVPAGLSPGSAWRRLSVCLLVLILADQAVLPILRISEAKRYESNVQVRFENSDLFLLGPLTEYLQEHPVGTKPRILFFGNSVVWGYGLKSHEAFPSVLQRLRPTVRVFNFGVNGFEDGSAYLMTKAMIDVVDGVYLIHQHPGDGAHSLLPRVIAVSHEDARRFRLELPSPFAPGWDRLMGFWHLGRYSYRLQGAWFGTSMRQYLYLHKGEWLRRLFGKGVPPTQDIEFPLAPRPRESATWEEPVTRHPVFGAERTALKNRYPVLWDEADLIATHHKHGTVIMLDQQARASKPKGWALFNAVLSPAMRFIMLDQQARAWKPKDWALLNAVFQPAVLFVHITVPNSWMQSDRTHLSTDGCRGLAELLVEHAAESFELRRR